MSVDPNDYDLDELRDIAGVEDGSEGEEEDPRERDGVDTDADERDESDERDAEAETAVEAETGSDVGGTEAAAADAGTHPEDAGAVETSAEPDVTGVETDAGDAESEAESAENGTADGVETAEDEWEWVSLPDDTDDGEESAGEDAEADGPPASEESERASTTDEPRNPDSSQTEANASSSGVDWAASRATEGPSVEEDEDETAGADEGSDPGTETTVEESLARTPFGTDDADEAESDAEAESPAEREPSTLEAPTIRRPEDDDDGLDAFLDESTGSDATTFESAMLGGDDGFADRTGAAPGSAGDDEFSQGGSPSEGEGDDGTSPEADDEADLGFETLDDGDETEESRPLSEKVADVLYTDDER